MRLLLEQGRKVIAIDFNAGRVCSGDGFGPVRRVLEHGGKAEELAGFGLLQDDLLMVFVVGEDTNPAGDQNIGPFSRIAGTEDVLVGRELFEIDLCGEHTEFVVVKVGE